jgi:FKBP-type peptidyl-prolyl cis-trans isomerase
MRSLLLLLLPVIACGGSGPTSAPPLSSQVFNPSLNVNLAASTMTPGGAYYRDLVVGTGATVITGSSVTVDYDGWLADGTHFGSSAADGSTFTFVLGDHQVLQGWEEGLAGVKAGGTRQLVIPAALGYGDRQRGNIPAYSNLVFQVVVRSATGPIPLEQTTFAASLAVDLAASTRTARGVYTRDTAAGSGAGAVAGQTLIVDYTGWLPDGTQFDSSQAHMKTFTFQLGKGTVIAGWDDGLIGVQAGATRQLVIPSELGYGAYGQGGTIPPYANLVFSVVVHTIQ